MKTYGRNSKILTAYATLFTVALGVVALDPVHRKHYIPAFPASTLAVQPATSTAEQKPTAIADTRTARPNVKTPSVHGAGKQVTVATYTTLRPAK
jgi:hypothetical protein